MASTAAGATGWYRGKVKAVPSGDCVVIMAMPTGKPGPLPEKSITLSSLMAPRLVILLDSWISCSNCELQFFFLPNFVVSMLRLLCFLCSNFEIENAFFFLLCN